jgi:hypothetical protein
MTSTRVTTAITTISSAARRLIHRIGRIRSSPRPPVMASAATSHSASTLPRPTATGSWYLAARFAIVMSDRSPSSASAITQKEVAATGQNPAASAFSRASSSSSSARSTSTAPARNTTATTICTILCGSRPRRLPPATASTACIAKAAAVPANTPIGRYLVPSTRVASPELSGSSTTKTVPKTIAAMSRPDTWSPPPQVDAVALVPGCREATPRPRAARQETRPR